ATTNNADEATYLNKIRLTLKSRGVWLWFQKKLYAPDSKAPSERVTDVRTFECVLQLGSDGDTIPDEGGRLTRKALLGTTVLGAGYYREVREGKVESARQRAVNLDLTALR